VIRKVPKAINYHQDILIIKICRSLKFHSVILNAHGRPQKTNLGGSGQNFS